MTLNPLHLSKPKFLKAYLESLGIFPKKSLSQNFLIDGNIVNKIIQFADIRERQTVLEIGPGPGALTEALISQGARVLAVEKDRTLARSLSERFRDVEVICDDILNVKLDAVLPTKTPVIANLPYNITSSILLDLLPKTCLLSHIVVMVQLEVAERLIAKPGNKTYGSLTVFANLYADTSWGFKVKKECFYPKPKVDSAVIRFDLKPPPPEVYDKNFFLMTRSAFGQRRKMLKSSLKKLYSSEEIVQSLSKLKLSATVRPEELSAEQFVALYKYLVAPEKVPSVKK